MRVNKDAGEKYVYQYKELNINADYVRNVLINYDSLLLSIENARRSIIDEISYLKIRYEEERDNIHLTAVNLDPVPFSATNNISDSTFNTVWKLDRKYMCRIEAEMDNLAYYEVLEERIRRVNNVFTKLSLIFPIHFLVTYETFVQHKSQDQVRGELQFAKATIRKIQIHMTSITAYLCNQEISVEEINSMAPRDFQKLLDGAECYEQMKKLEEMENEV